MGQKVNPHGLRVGIIKDWDTQWYADKKAFSVNLKEDYPRFEISRKLNKNDKYFGPYMAGVSAKEILSILDYAFGVRKCKLPLKENGKPSKPCLFKRCY